jgi:hypothetical protein
MIIAMQIENFERRWSESVRKGASDALEHLAREFYVQFMSPKLDLLALRRSVIRLLEFLCSSEGRTDANYSTADCFVCLLTAEQDDLFDRLPGEYRTVIDGIALDLYEMYQDPKLAGRLDATPESLLEQAQELDQTVN